MNVSFNTIAAGTSRDWSEPQRAIFDDARNGQGNSVVRARGGTGKTTTIMEALRHVPASARSLMVAFNKSIERELAKRAPEGAVVRTLHSFGFAAVNQALGKAHVDEEKVPKLLRAMFGDLPAEQRSVVCKGVSLAKATLAGSQAEIDELVDEFDLGVPDGEEEAFARIVLALLDASAVNTKTVDFDDMVWLPVRLGLRVPRFDRVFVDETQDLNACQVELALSACKPGGRICAVGDDRQAIYSWRGADPEAIPRLIRRLDAKVLPLSITYRCARAIVDVAREVVPDFEAAPGAEEGVVAPASSTAMEREAAPGDFVLSRVNAPLVGLCLAFLGEGRPATIAGRDIGANLASLVRRSKESEVDGLRRWIEAWGEAEGARLASKGKDPSPAQDKVECVLRLAAGAGTVDEVLGKIERLFSDQDDKSRIVLSTTHKAKGLERDRVWVLKDTYRRHETVEEDNLWYVAVTRAKRDLRLVGA